MTKLQAVEWIILRAYDEQGPPEIVKRYKRRTANLYATARSKNTNQATANLIADGLASALCKLGHLRRYLG